MPDIAFPDVDITKAVDEVGSALKDGAYVAVGLGVLGFQRAQVHRVEITRQLEERLENLGGLAGTVGAQVDSLRARLGELARSLDGQVDPARQQLEERLDRLEGSLPEAARGLVHSLRAAAVAQEQALREAVGLS